MCELLSLEWAKNDIYGNPRMRVCVYELESRGLSIDDLKSYNAMVLDTPTTADMFLLMSHIATMSNLLQRL